jgi:hypothetical protein
MPGNPRECRDNARFCLELAEGSRTQTERERFESLAQRWLVLATDYEATNLLLAEWGPSSPGASVVLNFSETHSETSPCSLCQSPHPT